MRLRLRILAACLAWLASTAVLSCSNAWGSENWPGWRGPTGMGQTDERDLPLRWGGKEQLNVLWKTPLYEPDNIRRDQNQSSPIVWGERLFVTVSYWPAGVPATEFPEHHVLCFHKETGKKLWDRQVKPGPWLLKDLRGGYTAPTPACDGRRIFVFFGSAVLAGISLDGELLWRKEIVPHFFDVAIGTSPVVYKSTVLVLSDQLQQASRLLAFSAQTGELKWERNRPKADWAHSTPVVAPINGKKQLLVGAANGLQGLDPDTGEKLWWVVSRERTGDTVSPVLGAGLVYCDSGRGGPGIAVEPHGKGDLSKTHVRWSIPRVAEGFSSPVAVGEYLFRLHNPSSISCWKMSDGVQMFRVRLEGVETAASPIASADGRIYCASSGKSYVLRARPKLDILAVNDLGDPSRASPAIAGGRIYFKGTRYLICVGKK
jgi:outer membrane protein assembly factor BamB